MLATKTLHDAISGFELIAPTIWDRVPSIPTKTPTQDTQVPSLILLMTWTGARGRHISKYALEYSAMFPSSHIMVITTSSADFIFRSSKRKQRHLQPAIEYISNLQHNSCRNSGGILMHVFSEGGSTKVCELASAYQRTTGTRLPLSALYLDSTPDHPHYLRLCSALAKSFPPVPVLKHFATVLATVVLGIIWVLYYVFIGEENNPVTKSRRQLLDPELFDLKIPRCYLYSKNDKLIAWQDVYEHVSESIKYSGTVTEILFETSGHVNHARQEPNRYWDAIASVWRQSQKKGFSEKEVRATCTLRELQPTKAFIKENKWSDADSQVTLLPPLPLTSSAEETIDVENRHSDFV